jgi:hypothetical protein
MTGGAIAVSPHYFFVHGNRRTRHYALKNLNHFFVVKFRSYAKTQAHK